MILSFLPCRLRGPPRCRAPPISRSSYWRDIHWHVFPLSDVPLLLLFVFVQLVFIYFHHCLLIKSRPSPRRLTRRRAAARILHSSESKASSSHLFSTGQVMCIQSLSKIGPGAASVSFSKLS